MDKRLMNTKLIAGYLDKMIRNLNKDNRERKVN